MHHFLFISFSGSQGRPDSRGPASDGVIPPGSVNSDIPSLTMSSLRSTSSYMQNGILCGGASSSVNASSPTNRTSVGNIIGPRIRQLQQQLNVARNSKPTKHTMPPPLMAVQTFGPKGSLV